MKLKHLKFLLVGALAFAFLIQIQPKNPLVTTAAAVIQADQASAQPAPTEPQFPPRTVKTVKWNGTICSNEKTREDHTMHLISREEIQDAVNKAGFFGEANRIMVALAYAEGQADLACESDWDISNNKWSGSIGLWQIRTLRAELGKGTCRDLNELRKLDIHFQAKCAYEISGQGKNFQPWAAFTSGRHRKYLQ